MPGWSGWAALGGQLAGGSPVAGRNADGRLEVFALSAGAAGPELVHRWQMSPGDDWSDWDNLGAPPGGFLDALTVAGNADGRLAKCLSPLDGATPNRFSLFNELLNAELE